MGIEGAFVVDEMRYFLGPDVAWIVEPRFDVVRRWDVRASLVDDPEFRRRWLLEYRDHNRRGIITVAHYDAAGYESPDWRGFTGEGPPRTLPGLPGTWPASTTTSSPARATEATADCPPKWKAASATEASSRR
jgi:hypothetical protein